MKSKKSFCKTALAVNNLKRFWWTSALYTILLFLIGPLWIFNQNTERLTEYNRVIYLDAFKYETWGIICFICVMVAVMVFRYLQNAKSTTLHHSLPITRKGLYISNFVSGLVLLLIPILLIGLVMILIKTFTIYGAFIEITQLNDWFLSSILFTTFLYSVTVMVGTFTGSSVAQIIFTYILNFLPVALSLGINYLLLGVVYGYGEMSEEVIESLFKIMPITQILIGVKLEEVWLLDIIITVISILIGYFVYRARDLERAGDVISNRALKPIFKYGVTFCIMGLGVIYVKRVFNIATPNLLVYILFALLGYAIAEMLIRKSFKVLDSYKGFIGYIGILFLAAILINADAFGYVKNIPEIDEVEYVAVGDYINVKRFKEKEENTFNIGRFAVLKQSDSIEKAIDLHKKIVSDKSMTFDGNFQMVYKLKNGKFIERTYFIDSYTEYYDDINAFYDLTEYKMNSNRIFSLKENDIIKINLTEMSGYSRDDVNITDKNDIKIITEMLKKSIVDTNFEERNKAVSLYSIEFAWETGGRDPKVNYDYMTLTKYDNELLNYLQEKGYLTFKIDGVNKVIIRTENSYIEKMEQGIEIVDPASVEKILSLREHMEQEKGTDDVKYFIFFERKGEIFKLNGCFTKNNKFFSEYVK